MNGNHGDGFTLIELLIVVAIIGILAAIAVPNFLNAQIRAKIAQVQADMRTFAQAIDLYQLDNQSFPWTDKNPYGAQPIELRWIPMTTPISYVNQIPVDPFGDKPGVEIERGQGNAYWTYDFWCARKPEADFPHWGWVTAVADRISRETGRSLVPPSGGAYFFASQGPDRITFANYGRAQVYHSSNGLISAGDMLRGGPGSLSFP
ncbi:prepilin-type N-terminal cleavage/methylation domain-containing protein [bacterium]|nr:prepilin-type N-terminal cleavage/methylation domain-containing protein [bacterium]